MGKYKLKDIIIIIVSSIIFVAAIAFMLDSGGGTNTDKSQPSSSELITEPEFIVDYDKDAYDLLNGLQDYGLPALQNTCKGDLFSIESPMPPDSVCYALQELGLLGDLKDTKDSNDTTGQTSRNKERQQILENVKEAIESYKQKNDDYPDNADDYQLAELLKEGGVLNSFLTTDSKKEDPSGENTRLCYARKSENQYWLYYVSEPTEAPSECKSEDPKDIEGVVDFSVR